MFMRSCAVRAGARGARGLSTPSVVPVGDSARVFGPDTIKATLRLPFTTLPVRAAPGAREPQLAQALTTLLYRRQRRQRRGRLPFTLHDGPPYANGGLHMGHLLNKTLKDAANRAALLEGRAVHFVPGWDCHGMPVEQRALAEIAAVARVAKPGPGHAPAPAPPTPIELRRRARQCAEAAIAAQRSDFVRWGVLADWDVEARGSGAVARTGADGREGAGEEEGEGGNVYVTMDARYESAQLDVFGRLLERGLVFRDLKPVHWSPSSATALAEAELEYNDAHVSSAVFVTFPFLHCNSGGSGDSDGGIEGGVRALARLDPRPSAVVWTTTPWTLPANVALAVHPDLCYCVVAIGGGNRGGRRHLLVAEGRLEALRSLLSLEGESGVVRDDAHPVAHPVEVVLQGIRGAELVGCLFAHPLQGLQLAPVDDLLVAFPELDSSSGPRLRASVVISAPHVTAESGTGIVHIAPGHGHEDFEAARAWNCGGGERRRLPMLCPVDDAGRFLADGGSGPTLAGLAVLREGSDAVVEMLRAAGALAHGPQRHVHRFPYDWRTKLPVIVRATRQWFVRVSDLLPDLMAAVPGLRMVPLASRQRLAATLASRRLEWCISRQRSWGVPVPALYRTDTGEALMTRESVNHVRQLLASRGGSDAWWSASAEELLPPAVRAEATRLGIAYVKGTDTLDVWFDSGTSWAAAWAGRDPSAPLGVVADLVIEGSDQHRGWFQSSLITSLATCGHAPYRAVLTHGFVLDQSMRKMSKSLGNVIAPADYIDGAKGQGSVPLGADVLRFWAASSDYTGDVSVGPAVLAAASDALRKVRSVLRFLLAALHDADIGAFYGALAGAGAGAGAAGSGADGDIASDACDVVAEAWRLPASPVLADASRYASLSLIDRCMLHRLALFERHARASFEGQAFGAVTSALGVIASVDLSAAYFEFAKDRLYCGDGGAGTPRRAAVQAVLWETLRVVTRVLAPIAVFTAQDVFEHSAFFLAPQRRAAAAASAATEAPVATALSPAPALPSASPFASERVTIFDAGTWACLPAQWLDDDLGASWASCLNLRSEVNAVLELARRAHDVGAPADARVDLCLASSGEVDSGGGRRRLSALDSLLSELERDGTLADLLGVSQVRVVRVAAGSALAERWLAGAPAAAVRSEVAGGEGEDDAPADGKARGFVWAARTHICSFVGASAASLNFGAPTAGSVARSEAEPLRIAVSRARGAKCARCRLASEAAAAHVARLCRRCSGFVTGRI